MCSNVMTPCTIEQMKLQLIKNSMAVLNIPLEVAPIIVALSDDTSNDDEVEAILNSGNSSSDSENDNKMPANGNNDDKGKDFSSNYKEQDL